MSRPSLFKPLELTAVLRYHSIDTVENRIANKVRGQEAIEHAFLSPLSAYSGRDAMRLLRRRLQDARHPPGRDFALQVRLGSFTAAVDGTRMLKPGYTLLGEDKQWGNSPDFFCVNNAATSEPGASAAYPILASCRTAGAVMPTHRRRGATGRPIPTRRPAPIRLHGSLRTGAAAAASARRFPASSYEEPAGQLAAVSQRAWSGCRAGDDRRYTHPAGRQVHVTGNDKFKAGAGAKDRWSVERGTPTTRFFALQGVIVLAEGPVAFLSQVATERTCAIARPFAIVRVLLLQRKKS